VPIIPAGCAIHPSPRLGGSLHHYRLRRWSLHAALWLAVGCSRSEPPTPADFASADAKVRSAALEAATDPTLAQRLLDDPDPALRAEALRVLTAIEPYETRRQAIAAYLKRDADPAALAPLIAAWGEEGLHAFRNVAPDPARTVALLERFTDPAQAPLLVALLDDQVLVVRHAAAAALVTLGPAALPALATGSAPTARPVVRVNAALVGWRIAPERPADAVLGPLLAANELALVDPQGLAAIPAACPWLMARAKDGPSVVLRVIGGCGAEARPLLLAALKARDRTRAADAALGLAVAPDPADLPALLRAYARTLADREEAAMDAADRGEEGFDYEDGDLPDALEQALVAQGAPAARALLDLPEPTTISEPDVRTLVMRIGPAAVPEILARLRRADEYERAGLVEMLIALPDARSIEVLAPLLGSRDPPVRAAEALLAIGPPFGAYCAAQAAVPRAALRRVCVTALTDANDPQHAPRLRAALDDADPGVVAAAAASAGRRSDQEALPRLRTLVAHPQGAVRRAAAEALGALRDAAGAPALVEAIAKLDRPGPDEEELGWPGAEPEQPEQRWKSAVPNAGSDALAAIGAPALPAIIAALEGTARPAAATRLLDALAGIRTEDAGARRVVLAKLGARDLKERGAALRAAVALKPPGYVEALLAGFASAWRSSDRSALGDHAHALGASSEPRGAQALLEALRGKGGREWHATLVGALAASRAPEAHEFLVQALEKRDLRILTAVPGWYVGLGQPGSEPALLAALARYGDQEMALLLINSGNSALEDGARRWAEDNGYTVITTGISTVRPWGSGGG